MDGQRTEYNFTEIAIFDLYVSCTLIDCSEPGCNGSCPLHVEIRRQSILFLDNSRESNTDVKKIYGVIYGDIHWKEFPLFLRCL